MLASRACRAKCRCWLEECPSVWLEEFAGGAICRAMSAPPRSTRSSSTQRRWCCGRSSSAGGSCFPCPPWCFPPRILSPASRHSPLTSFAVHSATFALTCRFYYGSVQLFALCGSTSQEHIFCFTRPCLLLSPSLLPLPLPLIYPYTLTPPTTHARTIDRRRCVWRAWRASRPTRTSSMPPAVRSCQPFRDVVHRAGKWSLGPRRARLDLERDRKGGID